MLLRRLTDCVERLRHRPATAAEGEEIRQLTAVVTGHQVELIPGVAQTLKTLGCQPPRTAPRRAGHDLHTA
ncbi:hypothetical protein [Streptomyces ochraceiscleroticus]|uniref:Transposase n=1 Tax=Streptomyces ochraceiscleroticus TaxID=47761 RepID=A0ABW1MLT7_9ACTN|nr:hypothetical protein [Streptomyces ochraceiscleroticus]